MLIRHAGTMHYALFWNGNNGLQSTYFVNNGLQRASMKRRFLNIICIKWCKFCNNNLLVVLGSKQGDYVETREPQARGLSVNSIADSLFLTFLIYFAEMSNYFLMKVNKRKSWKCLKCVKEFSRKFYLANWKFLSIFLGVFARIAKVAHFAQVINFRERVHRKTHPCKVDKNNRESAFLFAFVFFSTQQ